MFAPSYKICTVRGIPIKIDILLIGLMSILALMSLFHGPGAFIGSLIINIGLLISIVLHELGHSLVAIRKGCHVRQIVLTVIGGMAQLEEMPRRPRDEFLMAIMGPLVSIGIGLACWFGGGLIPESSWPRDKLVTHWALKGNVIQLIGLVNFILAGFNLLPAFPMDGGRIFRALLSPKYGRLRATFIAARLGRIVAICLAVWGLVTFTFTLLLIAAFVYIFAGKEYRQVRNEETGTSENSFFKIPFFRSPFSQSPPPPPPPRTTTSDAPGETSRSNDDNLVSISPPPYRKGPGSKAPVEHESPGDDFFRNLFDKRQN